MVFTHTPESHNTPNHQKQYFNQKTYGKLSARWITEVLDESSERARMTEVLEKSEIFTFLN
jgi:hypothetical protein